MRDLKLKMKARQLRRSGAFLDEIVEALDDTVGRSTIFLWVRDVPFKKADARKRGHEAASQAAQKKYAVLRQQAYDATDLRLLEDPIVRDFIVMYLAEGYRRNRHSVQICNSNPNIMRLSVMALCKLGRKQFTNSSIRLMLYPDHHDGVERRFWAKEVGLRPKQINIWRPHQKQYKSKYRRSEHGIMYLAVSDTSLRARLQALMDAVQASWK